MRFCEVCNKPLNGQERFCSQRCKAIAQTKEWQLIRELRRKGRVTFIQLTIMVQQHYNAKKVDSKLAELFSLLKEFGVEIKI